MDTLSIYLIAIAEKHISVTIETFPELNCIEVTVCTSDISPMEKSYKEITERIGINAVEQNPTQLESCVRYTVNMLEIMLDKEKQS